MKNYFFSNSSYGTCYTVMARNITEAIKMVKKHIKDEEKDTKRRDEGKTYREESYMDYKFNQAGKVEIGNEDFDIVSFKKGEVIETEYV